MHSGKFVFAQLMDHLPLVTFRRCVAKYPGRYPMLKFSHLDQFLCMAFAQLTFRESLRDIESCLRAHSAKLYHLGIRGGIAHSTLADVRARHLRTVARARPCFRANCRSLKVDAWISRRIAGVVRA